MGFQITHTDCRNAPSADSHSSQRFFPLLSADVQIALLASSAGQNPRFAILISILLVNSASFLKYEK